LVPNTNIVFGGSGGSRTVTITPAANQSGTATITVTVSDGALGTSDTFLMTVSAVNDAPTISNVPDQSILENASTGPLSFSIADPDNAAGTLVLTASSSNPALVPGASMVFGGSGNSRTITVTPAADQSGTATITVSVSDGVLTASDSFVLTVTSSSAPTYLFTEGFEGPGYENSDWFEDGAVNEDYTTVVLDGAHSLNFSDSELALRSLELGDEFHTYFQVRWLTWVGYRSLVSWDDGAWNVMASLYTENNVLRIAHGGTGVNGTTVINPNTTYHVWMEWTRGAGNNGTMKLYVSPTGAKPTTPDASITTGNGGLVRRMVLGALGGGNVVMDRLLVDDVPIGSQTAPAPQGIFAFNSVPGRLSIRKEPMSASIIVTVEADDAETYVIETSEDMRTWQPVASLPGGGEYKDAEAHRHHSRFYRASKLQ
jgi:hypothetical protein